jgi:hypothetical protein
MLVAHQGQLPHAGDHFYFKRGTPASWADWMRAPVGDTQNNWVQVSKTSDGKYAAAIGKETFDVQIRVSLVNGTIVSATIDNPVEVLERDCADAALTACGNPARYQIRRHVEVH